MPARRHGPIVGFATAGRPRILAKTIRELTRQSLRPSRILVSVPGGADVEGVDFDGFEVSIIERLRGLTLQRNAILRAALADARPEDCLVFFDDDFLPERHYLEQVDRLFSAHPDVAMATGAVLADGILGPGIDLETARLQLAATPPPDAAALAGVRDVYNCYGCNMAVRIEALRRTGALFDERLPLYGWLEDVDFSRALAQAGRIVRFDAAQGVHLGVKIGRQSGVRLGYSQIANPVYLVGKRHYTRMMALRQMSRNLAANLIRVWRPEPYVDRSGRLDGNIKAIVDLLAGRLAPERAALL